MYVYKYEINDLYFCLPIADCEPTGIPKDTLT